MVSIKSLSSQQQHPRLDNTSYRGKEDRARQSQSSRVGFGGFFGRRKSSVASIMSPPMSEHERLKHTWEQHSEISVDQCGDADVDMSLAVQSADAVHAENDVSGAHAANGMMPNGTSNGVSDSSQHANNKLLPPADNCVQMDKNANRKLFNSILCCIRSARPDRLLLRGSAPIRNVSLAASSDGNSAAGPLRSGSNSSENGFANNNGSIRYANGANAAAKHHNRMLNGYYRGPLATCVTNNAGIPLLPAPRAGDEHRKLLVIDLDETLVHSSFKEVKGADFVVPVEIDGVTHQVFVQKRPHVDEFLQKMGELYECVLFTASLAKYADPVADLLDKHNVFRFRLFRESCVLYRGNYVKDLSRLGRDLGKIIIVDNSPGSYSFHPENAVPVLSWFDDMSDRELLDLVPFLSTVSAEEANVTQTLKCINVYAGTDASGNQYVQSVVTKSMAAGDQEHGMMVRTTQERETTVQSNAAGRNNNGRAMNNNASPSAGNGIICSVQQSAVTTTSPTGMMMMNGFAQPLRAKDMMALLMSTLPNGGGGSKPPVLKQVKALNESAASSQPTASTISTMTTTLPPSNSGVVTGVKHISAHYHPSQQTSRVATASNMMPPSTSNSEPANTHRASTSSATRPSRLLDQLNTAKRSLTAASSSSVNMTDSVASSVASSSANEMPNSPTSPSYSTELAFSQTPVDTTAVVVQHTSVASAADRQKPPPQQDEYSGVRKLSQSIRNDAMSNLVGASNGYNAIANKTRRSIFGSKENANSSTADTSTTFTSSLQPRFTMQSTTSTTTTTSIQPPSTIKTSSAVYRSPSYPVAAAAAFSAPAKKTGEPGIDEYATDRAAVDGLMNNLSENNKNGPMLAKPGQFSTNSLRRRGELRSSNSSNGSSSKNSEVMPTSGSDKSSSSRGRGSEEAVIPFIDSNPATPTHDKAALLATYSKNIAANNRATQQQVAVANGVAGYAKAKLLAAASASSSMPPPPLIPQPVVSSRRAASKHALSYRKSGNYDNVSSSNRAGNVAGPPTSTSTVLSSNGSTNSGIKAAAHSLRSTHNNNHQQSNVPNGYAGGQRLFAVSPSSTPSNGSLLKQPTKMSNGVLPHAVQNRTANGTYSSGNYPHRTIVSLGATR